MQPCPRSSQEKRAMNRSSGASGWERPRPGARPLFLMGDTSSGGGGRAPWQNAGCRTRIDEPLATYAMDRGPRASDAASVIRCSGDVALASAGALRQLIDGELDAGQAHLVVDLEAATFVDSTALGLLIRAQRQCRQSG